MQLSPVYGPAPFIDLEEPPGAVLAPLARQRRRFVAALRALDADQLASAPTRCEGWSPRDVVSHLDTADRFWAWSATSGLGGEPTRLLANFDPVASPAQMAEGDARSGAEVVEALAATVEGLIGVLDGAADDAWRTLAEGPPGHISLTALAHHALWDGWTHERDVLVPLGLEPPLEPDEVAGSLRYAAALGPGRAVSRGEHDPATLAIVAHDPEVAFTVEVTDRIVVRDGVDADATLRLEGGALELAEALSSRAPLPAVDPERAWLVNSLRVAFDQA